LVIRLIRVRPAAVMADMVMLMMRRVRLQPSAARIDLLQDQHDQSFACETLHSELFLAAFCEIDQRILVVG
jgi:hypothetical protein